jgi:hypothetical protein
VTSPILTLSLVTSSPGGHPATLARELLRDLRRAGIRAEPSSASVAGDRGDIGSLGNICILVLSHSTAVLLAECLHYFILRFGPKGSDKQTATVRIKVKTPDSEIDISDQHSIDSAKNIILSLVPPRQPKT